MGTKTNATAIATPSAPPPAVATNDEPEPAGPGTRIRFKHGASTATIEGAALRGERNRYLLRAGQGQTMRVSISSLERNASFSLVQPDGKIVAGTEEEHEHPTTWNGKLPMSGDYVIVVGPTRGNATYKLTVTVKN